jgi:fused signal recognition particle receptor
MSVFNIFKKKPSESPDSEGVSEALNKTREGFFGKIGRALAGRSTIDNDFLDELEEILITADVGVDTTVQIIRALQADIAANKYLGKEELFDRLTQVVAGLMPEPGEEIALDFELKGRTLPYVILVVGVNGVGKTTTIGKLAWNFSRAGKKVVLGAGDTFRAAAVDQLGIWKDRTGAEIVSHGMNADPSSVAFDAVKAGVEKGADVVIIDTAGRLHNKVSLMNELAKMKRVVQKFKADAPHEVLLVIDATTGQNAFEQARHFSEATKVNALAVTKLDGTAKGGVVVGVSHQFGIPVKYIGVGEKAEDLRLFDKEEFLQSIFKG